ncbi:hypothetical protein [Pontibacter chitinilyticus]|uniref:hypothetical protein n=1 Tax=Pontibacter chitinilyticus TaxID=2674989 RepID=UPI003218F285
MWRSNAIGLSILIIYLMTTFRFLAPVVHYQLNYEHMATVLCVNRDKPIAMCLGKCQLKKELRQLHPHGSGKDDLTLLLHAFHVTEALPNAAFALSASFYPESQAPQGRYTYLLLCVSLPPTYHPPQV